MDNFFKKSILCKSLNSRYYGRFIIDLIFLLFIIIFLLSIFTQAECFDFEMSEGDGWNKGCFSPLAQQWQWDENYGYNSNGSMKSGEFWSNTLGLLSSSICREVKGPVDISFWWKSDTNPADCAKLIFLMDKRPIATIYGSDSWQRRTYSISDNKSHVIEWRYVVTNSPDLELGMGRIDDVCINSRSIPVEEEPVEEEPVEEEPVEEEPVEEEPVEEVGVGFYYNDTVYVEKNILSDKDKHIYNSISEAIDHVLENGTVKVGKGVYNENILIRKPLNLIGADKYDTRINAQDVILYVVSKDVIIKNVTINGGDIGILVNGGEDIKIVDNCITNCESYGVKIRSSSRLHIERNIITNNIWTGVCLDNSTESYIIGNTIHDSDIGVGLANSSNNMIDSNNISNGCYGIKLYNKCNNNRIGNDNVIRVINHNSCCDLFTSECHSCQNGNENIYYGAYERC